MKILVCQHCKEKLFYITKPLTMGQTSLEASLFRPYNDEIPQPNNYEPFVCPLCEKELLFTEECAIDE